jgi:hypothetical protein
VAVFDEGVNLAGEQIDAGQQLTAVAVARRFRPRARNRSQDRYILIAQREFDRLSRSRNYSILVSESMKRDYRLYRQS